ncbi:MAG: S-layer homology domain-containing protein, partial [Ruminococcaceae bacterium]|nr:S-layer homology domain-containing protein [Oscillospiraceae bacterium]
EDTPYAAEIAIGRALGILKGTGDDLYNPNAEISRQDLMVICARGMRAVKALEEGGNMDFSDTEAIADYAVLDIAAVVRAGIVRGNADGTLNPLGNTTRAEAAVIMDRIATWSAEP